jgi:hypothetical protein
MRYHNINGEKVQYTAEEETFRDNEEQSWLDEATVRNAQDTIRKLEATVTLRRIREMTTDAGKKWMEDLEAKIAIERSKL